MVTPPSESMYLDPPRAQVEVYGYSMFSNELVGHCDVGLARTYASPGHEMYKKWTPIIHPEKGKQH